MPIASISHKEAIDARAARLLTIALLLAVLFIVWPSPTVHAQQAGYAERVLLDAANRERTAQGLRPLRWDDALASAAREHALRMAQQNTLSHQLPGELPLLERARLAGARYMTIAENVAEGPTAEMIHSSWMHSPPHRANLLDPELTAVGIAVTSISARNNAGGGAPGMLFAVEDFSQAVANLNHQQQEQQVSMQLVARGLVVDAHGQATEDARKTCEMDRGWSGGRPGLVVRYEAGDLSRLPDELEQKIQSGRYRAAAVGACDSTAGTRGFTRYRVAVLLY
jgi:Cysteine-rich secretory protein family